MMKLPKVLGNYKIPSTSKAKPYDPEKRAKVILTILCTLLTKSLLVDALYGKDAIRCLVIWSTYPRNTRLTTVIDNALVALYCNLPYSIDETVKRTLGYKVGFIRYRIKNLNVPNIKYLEDLDKASDDVILDSIREFKKKNYRY